VTAAPDSEIAIPLFCCSSSRDPDPRRLGNRADLLDADASRYTQLSPPDSVGCMEAPSVPQKSRRPPVLLHYTSQMSR
jgi:hypothetical protein